jgi:serine/threonine-protein kinase HipA
MTSPSDFFVWVWLPGATSPVVAGRIRRTDRLYQFGYGQSYLSRSDAVSLFTPQLPLQEGWMDPPDDDQEMAGCLWDASPDGWGQRVIIARLTGKVGQEADDIQFDQGTFLLESGSNRIGALDFQASADDYVPRMETATLDELHAAAEAVLAGEDLRDELARALVDGTAVGGARPKVLIKDGGVEYIAKLSTSTDPYPMVKAEAAAMELARRVGIQVPNSRLTQSLGRDVLLVERFDRPAPGERRMMVSALTMLGFGTLLGARYSTYPDLLNELRKWAISGVGLGRTLFERVTFNVAVGNTDDHARNHAAFWDGRHLELTPAYDLCPQQRTGREASQAMGINAANHRSSTFATCVASAAEYGLTGGEAREVVDRQVTLIQEQWDEVAEMAELTATEKRALFQRQILNPYASS